MGLNIQVKLVLHRYSIKYIKQKFAFVVLKRDPYGRYDSPPNSSNQPPKGGRKEHRRSHNHQIHNLFSVAGVSR